MVETLFDLSPQWAGDPCNPPLNTHTPVEMVAALPAQDRRRRVEALIRQAHGITDLAIGVHAGGKPVAAWCLLWSGGNDSNVLAHLMRPRATHVIHANTGIGIEQTRQHVRDHAAAWGLPLIERKPPKGCSYRELVIDRGFPGPSQHYKMYQRLKERTLDAVRKELTDVRRNRLVYFAGRRREESRRRSSVPLHERDGSVIWVSPLANWTKLDLNTYRQMHAGVPNNEVSDLLHMSGECLCGAFAKQRELDQIREWFPDVASEIDQLERDVRAAGHPEPLCRWGWGAYRKAGDPSTRPPRKEGRLCSSCSLFGESH